MMVVAGEQCIPEESRLLQGCRSALSVTLAATEEGQGGVDERSQQDGRGTI